MAGASSTSGDQKVVGLHNSITDLQPFKIPPTDWAKKKPKPKILTEEKYIEELSKIIQRDFFPDLEKLRAQNSYLDAMERNDYNLMEAIRLKYSGRRPTERSLSMSPATFETPLPPSLGDDFDPFDTPKSTSSKISTKSTSSSEKSVSQRHSLDSFLHNYTSEDNYSFQEILETAGQKLKEKFAVLYNEETVAAEKLALALTVPSIEDQFQSNDPMRKIETWTYTNKNTVMYTPEGVEFTEEERVEAAKRKQSIQHRATRLSMNPFPEMATPRQDSIDSTGSIRRSLSSDKVGFDGNNLRDGVAGGGNIGGGGGAAAAPASSGIITAPQFRGFDLLKTPSPRPGEAFSPLMTWGEIEGTPFRLDGSDTPLRTNSGPSFKISETSRRENIALALAEKVGVKMRAQKQRAAEAARKNIASPFLRTNMERLASISPAARRLAASKLRMATPLFTPSPARTNSRKRLLRSGSSTPSAASHSRKTLASMSNDTPTAPNALKDLESGKSTLTDDLLKIPTKRLKASDFF